ncbi:MAG: hypothetical protein LUG19_08320 [Desulfovibrio sp.]|uniref:hypothetical protein n=1 Tax=Desulfovibrio sp. TaxID=885 RepID=UPI002583E0D0|nr:hypothetical protein [Desulfovibrio sp.]MCD7984241.1 hypothetical protein [Desulfovibrio sp.]
MAVQSPKNLGTIQFLQTAQKNPACQMFHLHKQIGPELFPRGAGATQKPSYRYKATLAFEVDPAHGMTRHFSKIAIHQKDIHAAQKLLMRSAKNTADITLLVDFTRAPAFVQPGKAYAEPPALP